MYICCNSKIFFGIWNFDPCAVAVVVEPVGRSRRSAGDQSGPSGQPLDPAQPPASRDPYSTLLEKFWLISLYVTDDAFAKLSWRKVKSNRGKWFKISEYVASTKLCSRIYLLYFEKFVNKLKPKYPTSFKGNLKSFFWITVDNEGFLKSVIVC